MMGETLLDIPAAWQRSAKRILSEGWRRILVVGATDCDKSSYCKFLVNALLGEGRPVSFVAADIGQKDVGPPATVARGDFEVAEGDGRGRISRIQPATPCTSSATLTHSLISSPWCSAPVKWWKRPRENSW